ncbi:hypothetical protein BDW71DRAFT_182565 [Aspergillus fruticulosus]
MAVLYCLSGCAMLVMAFVKLLLYMYNGHDGNDAGERPADAGVQMDMLQMQTSRSSSPLPSDTPNAGRINVHTPVIRYSIMLLKFVALAPFGISTIVFAEKMLAGNNIDLSDAPLLSSGQLIPFIVGLAGLASTVWSVTVGQRLALARKERKERTRAGAGTQFPLGTVTVQQTDEGTRNRPKGFVINNWLGREEQV